MWNEFLIAQEIQETAESRTSVPLGCRGRFGALAPWQMLNQEAFHQRIINLLQVDMLTAKPMKEMLDDLCVGLNAGQHMPPTFQMENKALENYAEMNRSHPTSYQRTPEQAFQHCEPPRGSLAQGRFALNQSALNVECAI